MSLQVKTIDGDVLTVTKQGKNWQDIMQYDLVKEDGSIDMQLSKVELHDFVIYCGWKIVK